MTNDITIYDKDTPSFELVYGLSSGEYACNCNYEDCTHQLVSDKLLNKYAIVRKYYGKPITITSGYRCQRHNKDSSGIKRSYHKIGAAIDLWAEDLKKLEEICKLYFDVVILYEQQNFIHCQLGELNED